MGLGKTIQVLSLLLVLKREAGGTPGPSLLVAPASLLANWVSETERFAPELRTLVASVGHARCGVPHNNAGPSHRCRHGDHYLWVFAPRAVDRRGFLACSYS